VVFHWAGTLDRPSTQWRSLAAANSPIVTVSPSREKSPRTVAVNAHVSRYALITESVHPLLPANARELFMVELIVLQAY